MRQQVIALMLHNLQTRAGARAVFFDKATDPRLVRRLTISRTRKDNRVCPTCLTDSGG